MTRVLFVDDEPHVLAALRRNLAPYHDRWQLEFAAGGEAAVAMMTEAPVDVIVTDFRMPGMTGGQLLDTVRRRWPDTGRLMLSGHTDEQDLLEVMPVAQTFLDKPCDRDALVGAIERSLRLRTSLTGLPIRGRIGALELLPTTDVALDELNTLIESPTVSESSVLRIIEGDIGLAVKVLQLANSSFFGGEGQVRSLPQAMRQIGYERVRAIAVLRGLATPVHEDSVVSASWVRRLNANARATATIAADLVHPDDAAAAYCAALLQECGQLALAVCRPEVMSVVVAEPGGDDAPMSEMAAFGATHAHIGAYLLSLWGLPTQIVDAVCGHDQAPPDTPGLPVTIEQATRIARVRAAGKQETACLSALAPAAQVHG